MNKQTKYFLLMVMAVSLMMSATVHAQVAGAIDTAGRFSSELAGLKTSADRLAMGNEQLLTRNNELRLSLSQYQGRLQKLLDEANALTRETLKLRDVNPSRANKISELEKAVFDLEAQLEQTQDQLKQDQDLLNRTKEEDLRLTNQIISLGASAAPAQEIAPIKDFTKEKLRILKMIDESKRRQQIITQQLVDGKRNKPVSVVTIEGSNDKEKMLAKIRRLEEEIDQLGRLHAPVTKPQMWDEKELRQLDQQVSALQKNHDELESLVAKMQEKFQKMTLNKDEMKEQRRLQGSFDDVTKENRQLKQDLNDLRLKMVELDKRKSYLEGLLSKKKTH